jgi:predicted nucleic acid-binding protein
VGIEDPTGRVRITTLTRLEVGFSARSDGELRTSMVRPPLASMPVEYLTPAIEVRAVAVQAALADRGQDRAPSIQVLLNAATAELAQLTLLHLDRDYELIADVTGQPVERLKLTGPAEGQLAASSPDRRPRAGGMGHMVGGSRNPAASPRCPRCQAGEDTRNPIVRRV